MASSSLRLFFAIDLDDKTRKKLAAVIGSLHPIIPSKIIRWIPLENLHLTARFIGECKPEQVSLLIEKTQTALKNFGEFTLQFNHIELFPTNNHPRILSVGVSPCPQLYQCMDRLEQAIVASGFPGETRSYKPHLSIARFTRRPVLESINFPELKAEMLVNHLVLFNSKQQKEKRVYEPLQIIQL